MLPTQTRTWFGRFSLIHSPAINVFAISHSPVGLKKLGSAYRKHVDVHQNLFQRLTQKTNCLADNYITFSATVRVHFEPQVTLAVRITVVSNLREIRELYRLSNCIELEHKPDNFITDLLKSSSWTVQRITSRERLYFWAVFFETNFNTWKRRKVIELVTFGAGGGRKGTFLTQAKQQQSKFYALYVRNWGKRRECKVIFYKYSHKIFYDKFPCRSIPTSVTHSTMRCYKI